MSPLLIEMKCYTKVLNLSKAMLTGWPNERPQRQCMIFTLYACLVVVLGKTRMFILLWQLQAVEFSAAMPRIWPPPCAACARRRQEDQARAVQSPLPTDPEAIASAEAPPLEHAWPPLRQDPQYHAQLRPYGLVACVKCGFLWSWSRA